MSRLSEEILKLIEEKTSLSPLRNKEKERYIPPTAKDLAKFIASAIEKDYIRRDSIKIDENKAGLLMFGIWNRGQGSKEVLLNFWTAKHIQTESKKMCAKLAKALSSADIIKEK